MAGGVLQSGDPLAERVLVPRPWDRNPRNPACPAALRRVCGVCRHFSGDLGTVGDAECGYFDLPRASRDRADSCHRFDRKGGGNV